MDFLNKVFTKNALSWFAILIPIVSMSFYYGGQYKDTKTKIEHVTAIENKIDSVLDNQKIIQKEQENIKLWQKNTGLWESTVDSKLTSINSVMSSLIITSTMTKEQMMQKLDKLNTSYNKVDTALYLKKNYGRTVCFIENKNQTR
jgi:hypothetical protein